MDKLKKNKALVISLIIVAIFVMILIILFATGTINLKNNKTNSTNNINETIEIEEHSKHIDINSNSLYTDVMDYTNYSRMTEKSFMRRKYYINDGKLFSAEVSGGETTEVNINGEKAKYIAYGNSGCSGSALLVLTENGNVYQIDMNHTVSKIYGDGKAQEILIINRDIYMFSTCETFSSYILIDNKLYYLPNYDDKIIEKEIIHPYSLIIEDTINKNQDKKYEYLLYQDGSINKYVYYKFLSDSRNFDIQNEFVKDNNGNKILISFVYYLDNIIHFVDTKGNVYSIVRPTEKEAIGYTEFKLEESKDFEKKVKSIDIIYKNKYNSVNGDTLSQMEQITFNLEDGTKKVYSTDNNDNIAFDSLYYFSNWYSNEEE